MYLAGGSATHVILKYSLYQQVQLVYSASAGTYFRYQHGDVPHLDAENGELVKQSVKSTKGTDKPAK